jgi:hypothetical protein
VFLQSDLAKPWTKKGVQLLSRIPCSPSTSSPPFFPWRKKTKKNFFFIKKKKKDNSQHMREITRTKHIGKIFVKIRMWLTIVVFQILGISQEIANLFDLGQCLNLSDLQFPYQKNESIRRVLCCLSI